VGDQDNGSPGRPVSSGLQVSGEPGQKQHPLGEIPAAFFFQNVLQLHQQRQVILRVDSLALWKVINEEDAIFIPKNRGENFSSGFFAVLSQSLQCSALFRLLCVTRDSCRNLMPRKHELFLKWQQNRSKSTMSLLYKIPAQDVFSRLTAMYRNLLPNNPYRVPQHYKRHVCGQFFNRKHRFLWICPIIAH